MGEVLPLCSFVLVVFRFSLGLCVFCRFAVVWFPGVTPGGFPLFGGFWMLFAFGLLAVGLCFEARCLAVLCG